MIGHGCYPQLDDADLPASLSRRITTQLLRETTGFDGLAVSDDMEMHAVSDLGSYEAIAERALKAGNDVILFCSHIERVPDIHSFLERRVKEDAAIRARFDDARARAERYRTHCAALRAKSAPAASFDAVLDEAKRFSDEFAKTHEVVVPDIERRKTSRSRSGREEWT